MRRKNTTPAMTCDYLVQALLILLQDHDFEQITISQITAKAGVNRSTYYRHFSSKLQLAQYYYAELLDKQHQLFSANGPLTYQTYLELLFNEFKQRQNNILILHHAGLSIQLLPVLKQSMQHFKNVDRWQAAYHIGGIYNGLLTWFDEGMQTNPQQLAAKVNNFMPADMRLLFNNLNFGKEPNFSATKFSKPIQAEP